MQLIIIFLPIAAVLVGLYFLLKPRPRKDKPPDVEIIMHVD